MRPDLLHRAAGGAGGRIWIDVPIAELLRGHGPIHQHIAKRERLARVALHQRFQYRKLPLVKAASVHLHGTSRAYAVSSSKLTERDNGLFLRRRAGQFIC